MACYWGWQPAANFATWIIVAVCVVTGCIWMPIGAVDMAGCGYCWSEFKPALTPFSNVTDEGCRAARSAFYTIYEEKMNMTNARDDFYDWCVNSGPLAEVVAGSVVLGFGLLAMSYFCCCAKKPEDHGHKGVSMA